MATSLNVLVLESESGAAEVAHEELVAAGHTVLRCHEPGAPAFPCNALAAGKQCPLEGTVVDVALDVHAGARSQPSPREDGVSCALRHQIPVVVAGHPALNPYEDFATEVLGRNYDVVETCERVAASPRPRHTEVATSVLHEVLERHGIDAAPAVTVRRVHGGLVADVTGAAGIDEKTKQMAAVRMSGALRALDRYARGIDVNFRDS